MLASLAVLNQRSPLPLSEDTTVCPSPLFSLFGFVSDAGNCLLASPCESRCLWESAECWAGAVSPSLGSSCWRDALYHQDKNTVPERWQGASCFGAFLGHLAALCSPASWLLRCPGLPVQSSPSASAWDLQCRCLTSFCWEGPKHEAFVLIGTLVF